MPVPLPVIAGVFRCALNWGSGSQTAVNVIHIRGNTIPDTAANVFEAMDDAVTGVMWDSVTSTASVQTVSITPLDGVTGTQVFPTGSPVKWSGQGTQPWQPNAAHIVKLETGLRGRNHRGRIFLPFFADDAGNDGAVDAGTATAMTAAWTAFAAALAADAPNSYELGVASYDRRHGGAGAGFVPVANILAETVQATQRRRQSRLR